MRPRAGLGSRSPYPELPDTSSALPACGLPQGDTPQPHQSWRNRTLEQDPERPVQAPCHLSRRRQARSPQRANRVVQSCPVALTSGQVPFPDRPDALRWPLGWPVPGSYAHDASCTGGREVEVTGAEHRAPGAGAVRPAAPGRPLASGPERTLPALQPARLWHSVAAAPGSGADSATLTAAD